MLYSSVKDILSDWKFESEATLKILSALSDESLTTKISGSERELGRVAWHLAITLSEMGSKIGLDIVPDDENSDPPLFANQIKETYEKNSSTILDLIKKNWNDDSLKEEVNMYGEVWKKGSAVESLIKHQIHHRGQLTMLMRYAGLKVPGIYGPSREEWAGMGMEPMK